MAMISARAGACRAEPTQGSRKHNHRYRSEPHVVALNVAFAVASFLGLE
jgi:hypothetical protein